MNKLNTAKILFITGRPNIGKSTFLLYLLGKYLENKGKIWDSIFFINPLLTKEELDTVLADIKDLIQKQRKGSNILLVIDGLRRKESDSNFISKSSKIFTEVSNCGYKLVITLREDEYQFLKRGLGDIEVKGIDEWIRFEPISEEINLKYNKEKLKKILVNYLNYHKDKIIIQGLSYKEINDYFVEVNIPPEKREKYLEFNECLISIVEKSEGLAGYIAFLIEDISKNSGIFEKKTVTEYPEGMVNLFWSTISRDYYIKEDRVIPLCILFLKEIEYPVTKHFFDTLKEWGLKNLHDKLDENTKKKISEKLDHFLEFHTVTSVFLEKIEYLLSTHWEFAIIEAINSGKVDNRYKEVVNKFKEIHNQLLYMVNTCVVNLVNELKNQSSKYYFGEYPDPIIFYIVADIAKLDKVTNKDFLDYPSKFFEKYCNNMEEDLPMHVSFLRLTLSFLWRSRADSYMEVYNYEEAINSYGNSLKINSNDYKSCWGVGVCYERLNKDDKAIEYFTKSAYMQDTSNSYCSLVRKLNDQNKKYGFNDYIKKLGNCREQQKASRKAIECSNTNYINWITFARTLKLNGIILKSIREYSEAKRYFEFSKKAYIVSLALVEATNPKINMSFTYWELGYCYLNLRDVNRKLNDIQECSANLDLAIKSFELAADLENSNEGYLQLLICMSWSDLYSKAQDICIKAIQNINTSQLSEKEMIDYYLAYGRFLRQENRLDNALEYFSNAKKLIFSKYFDYSGIPLVNNEENKKELVDDIYQELGICYETMGELDKAVENYSVYLDLNEYITDNRSGTLHRIYGRKYLDLGLYDEARICFWRSLIRDPYNSKNLRGLAHANMACGRYEEAIQNLKNCISLEEQNYEEAIQNLKSCISLDEYRSDKDDYSFCEKILDRRKEISFILENVCEVADLSINNAERHELSNAWYQVALDIKDILLYKERNAETEDKEFIEFEDLVISSLVQSIKINIQNQEAWNQLAKEIGQDRNETEYKFHKHYRNKYNLQYHQEKANLFGKDENHLLRIFNQIYSITIFTSTSYYRLNKDIFLNSKDRRKIKYKLSHDWSKIGEEIKKINEVYVTKIPYTTVEKCCEISIKIRTNNSAAWHHLGWACYYIGLFNDDTSYYEKAKKAFNSCIKIEEEKDDIKYSYTSKIGIGNVFEKQGDLLTAKNWFNGAINQKDSFGLTEKDMDLLLKTAKKMEYLRFSSSSKNEEVEFMRDTLAIYSKALSICRKSNLTDHEIILLDEKIRLLKKQILRAEKSVQECDIIYREKMSSEDSLDEMFQFELEEIVPATSIMGKIKKIILCINKNSEDYNAFEKLFRSEFAKRLSSKNYIENILYKLVSFDMKIASINSPFEQSAKTFQFCQRLCKELYGEEQAKNFMDIFNDRAIPRFRRIFMGDEYKMGPLNSKNEKEYVLAEFTKAFGEMGAKIPSLSEIEEEIIRYNT